MAKKYVVRLSEAERVELETVVKAGRVAARKRLHAQILLKADEGEHGPAWSDAAIRKALDVGVRTVERVRQCLVEAGLPTALNGRPQARYKSPKLDGEQEAHLIAVACSAPPAGRNRWTLRLLAERMVELAYVDTLSYETVRQGIKKNELQPWLKAQWCIPPEANAEFVCAMEAVLEVSQRPYDDAHPLLGMDESSKQLVKEVRSPLPGQPGEPEKYDFEYERNGVSNLFLFFEPLSGKRYVNVTEQRTAVDWAHQIQERVDIRYPHAERITRVMDNLNTPVGASLYKTFEPQEARRLLDKLELHYTPKHGSWLNMAELELSVLSRQCLDRRIPDQETLERELKAWEARRNASPAPVKWRFTTADARIKLKRLYPSLQR
ncbi:MAG TPA: IS630 family transposase [Armatimonadota bacterium]|nr:IS630 family transposase [Armatimonadota bacterium]